MTRQRVAGRPNYVALLRGVNVGKARRVPMANLRELLVGLGRRQTGSLVDVQCEVREVTP